MKVTVCQRKDYKIRFEEIEGLTFVHADVYKWSPKVKTEFLLDLNDLHFLRGANLYALNLLRGQVKREKFMKLMGFVFRQSFENEEGTWDIFERSR